MLKMRTDTNPEDDHFRRRLAPPGRQGSPSWFHASHSILPSCKLSLARMCKLERHNNLAWLDVRIPRTSWPFDAIVRKSLRVYLFVFPSERDSEAPRAGEYSHDVLIPEQTRLRPGRVRLKLKQHSLVFLYHFQHHGSFSLQDCQLFKVAWSGTHQTADIGTGTNMFLGRCLCTIKCDMRIWVPSQLCRTSLMFTIVHPA